MSKRKADKSAAKSWVGRKPPAPNLGERKTEFLEKAKLEPSRKLRYKRAHEAYAKVNQDANFSDWVRSALDHQADLDLGTTPRK